MEKFNDAQVKQLRDIVSDIVVPLHRTLDARIDTLETRMENGFAALAEDIADTRAQLAESRIESNGNYLSLHAEVRDIRKQIDVLDKKVQNNTDLLVKTVDLKQRVVRIEAHLGIKQEEVVG